MVNNYLSVLVVDDEAAIQKFLKEIIETLGHSVKTAKNHPEALLKLSQGRFDLAFMDVNLPDGDGVELIRTSKTLFPEINIVAMAGGATRNEEITIREQRVIFFLIKPFTRKEIQEIVDHMARKKIPVN